MPGICSLLSLCSWNGNNIRKTLKKKKTFCLQNNKFYVKTKGCKSQQKATVITSEDTFISVTSFIHKKDQSNVLLQNRKHCSSLEEKTSPYRVQKLILTEDKKKLLLTEYNINNKCTKTVITLIHVSFLFCWPKNKFASTNIFRAQTSGSHG